MLPCDAVRRAVRAKAMPKQAPRILIVEDEKVMRLKLQRILEQDLGAEVLVAEDGEQAWEIFQAAEDVQFVISDWVMPRCDGVELCGRIRSVEDRPYTYFIIATARSEDTDFVEGMASGADDYITKPVNNAELLARVRAGLRMVVLERSLALRNRELERALIAASQMQQGMLPSALLLERVLEKTGLRVSYRYEACESLGGDVLGLAEPEEGLLALFLGDVSGHGIPASLAAVGLHTFLQTNLSVTHDPVQLMQLADHYCGAEFPSGVYSTLVYLRLHTRERVVDAVVAGHPPLFHVKQDGSVARYHASVPPLGLFPNKEETFEVTRLKLESDERLIAYTDGVVETRNQQGQFYSEDHLARIVAAERGTSLEDLHERVMADVANWRGLGQPIEDDVTLVSLQLED